MSLRGEYFKRDLQFRFDAGTSRGVLKSKLSYLIRISDKRNPHVFGMGESGPLQGLSIDFRPELEQKVLKVVTAIDGYQPAENECDIPLIVDQLVEDNFPSLKFALETALLDLYHGGKRIIFKNEFVEGKKTVPVNGLIWMGGKDFMLQQIKDKLEQGFRCIKLKIGALDFEKECEILNYIRSRYAAEEIELRVDANGAFLFEDALKKLEVLSKYNIHSIEQPIAAGQNKQMEFLCKNSPIPIALDEELIGIVKKHLKEELLYTIKPQYIILKPTLLGGFSATKEWIDVAEKLNIGWWATSALESNIGLNAISQFVANYETIMPQGLGTGKLFTNNFDSPLYIVNGFMHYDKNFSWDVNL